MAEILPMLALSPTMEEGVVALWLKKEGDSVENGDVICEVETDKATMEYTSMAEGVLLKILIPENGTGRVGDPLAVIGEEGESIDDLLASTPAPSAGAAEPPEETALQEEPEAQPEAELAKTEQPELQKAPARGGKVRATPAARGLAAEKGVDLTTLSGSGPNGRVILADVEAAEGRGPVATAVKTVPVVIKETDEVLKLSSQRKVIAERLSASKFSAPHFYLKLSVEMDKFIKLRRDLGEMQSAKVSFNAMMMKMVAQALKRNPVVNSSWNGDSIVQHQEVDVALAVAVENGLLTPVVRDCGRKSMTEIDAELADLIERAKDGKLQPEDYSNSTFTISNLGSFGIEEFTAIINPPGSAILAVGQTRREQVVAADDAVSIKSVLKLTLSCDHRVIDGAVGALFMRDLKAFLEEPSLALA